MKILIFDKNKILLPMILKQLCGLYGDQYDVMSCENQEEFETEMNNGKGKIKMVIINVDESDLITDFVFLIHHAVVCGIKAVGVIANIQAVAFRDAGASNVIGKYEFVDSIFNQRTKDVPVIHA
ncbi:MAG: hypothetical protein V1707_00940 [bacterium]